MGVLAFLKDNASVIAAVFSVIGVLIGYGNYRLNMAQSAFQMGMNPIFEPSVEPVEGHAGWWDVILLVRNRAPATLVIRDVAISRWRRCRLLERPYGAIPKVLSPDGAKRRIAVPAEILPVGKSSELGGHVWRSDASAIAFLLYCPSGSARIRATWRSKSSTRWRRSTIVL